MQCLISRLTVLYSLPTAKIANPDVTRLINSTEIQSVVRPAGPRVQKRPWTQKKNPLVNRGVLFRMNPYAKTLRRQELRTYPIYLSFIQINVSCITLMCYSQAGACQGTKRQEGKEGQGLLRRRGFPQHVVRSLSVLKLWLATSTSIVLSSHALMHSCHAKIANHGDSTLLVLLINFVPLHTHSAEEVRLIMVQLNFLSKFSLTKPNSFPLEQLTRFDALTLQERGICV